MGRVRQNIEVAGHSRWTLFDGGSRNTYIIESIVGSLPQYPLLKVYSVALGGKVHHITNGCTILAKVEGLPVDIDAYILDEIGLDEDDKQIEILFGALAMQKWGIRPLPDEERVDMSHYPKEFVEF